jgi:hypothetical protein
MVASVNTSKHRFVVGVDFGTTYVSVHIATVALIEQPVNNSSISVSHQLLLPTLQVQIK